MYFFWVLAFFAALTSYFISNLPETETDFEKQISSEAYQMKVYHEAARSFCELNPATCAGDVEIATANVTGTLPPSVAGGASYNAGKFQSFSDASGSIITIHSEINARLTGATLEKFRRHAGLMSVQLIHVSGLQFIAGAYDRPNLVVTNQEGVSEPVSNVIAGVSLNDNVPILVTP